MFVSAPISGTRVPGSISRDPVFDARLAGTPASCARAQALCDRPRMRSGSWPPAIVSTGRKAQLVTCGVTTTREREAVMFRREKVHNAAVTAALVLSDEPGRFQVLTAALDKTLSFWSAWECGETYCNQDIIKIVTCEGPVFSVVSDTERCDEKGPLIFCGTAQRNVGMWEPLSRPKIKKVPLTEHSGWVRGLAAEGRWLFSCACNTLHQWDLMWANPRHVTSAELYSGDILDVTVGGGRVYTCGVDGSIHSWKINEQGKLQMDASVPKAHEGRVSGMVLHHGALFTVGFDGHLKAWNATDLAPKMDRSAAHSGERVQCIALGPDSVLYTGGDDKLIQRWNPRSLTSMGPLYGHHKSVRVLSAGRHRALVSGDSGGHAMLWVV